jgi:hypothetical protein
MRLLKLEIKDHYARLDIIKREQIHLHLFILANVHAVVWLAIEENLREVIRNKLLKKRHRQTMKFRKIPQQVSKEPAFREKPSVIHS